MLQQYIKEVLFRQQRCVIPQIGTFAIRHIPAHFSVVDQVLTPPGQQVTFEPAWEDDGSCMQWISQKENLIGSVAALKMNKYLDELNEKLESGRPITIAGVGALQRDAAGGLSFTPQELPDAWAPVPLQPVLRPDAAPKVLVGNTEMMNHQVVEHTSPVPEEFESQGRFRWWWAAIPLALIAIGVSWWLVQDKMDQETKQLETLEDSLASQPAPVKDSIPAVQQIKNDTISYFVVFQTFNLRQTAEKNHRNRIAWGYTNVVLYASKDSLQYKLAIPVRSLPADTTAAKDSVAAKFKANVHIEY